MAYLGDIIQEIERAFQVTVQGQYHTRDEIEGARFLTDASCRLGEHDRHHLYLFSDESLPVPDLLPPHLLIVGCQQEAANCLSVREALDIHALYNNIQATIFRHFKVKLKREELFFSLHSDNGIEGLTNVAHTYLNNPVTICDTSFAVLAACPVVRDTQNLEERQGRMYLRQERFQDMEDRNILKHIYSSTTPYITSLANHPYKWVFESIRIHHSVVGYICVRGSVRNFTEDDMEFIDVLAKMLSVEMQKDSSFSHPTGLKYEYFLTELLEGHFERSEYIVNHMLQLGRVETPFYTVMILKFLEVGRRPRSLKNYYDQLLSLLPSSMVVLFHGDLTILLPTKKTRPLSPARRKRFEAFLNLNHMRAFISYTYTDISKSHIHYQQIRELSELFSEHTFGTDSLLIYFNQYYLEHLFHRCADNRVLIATIHPAIRRLLDYDQETGSEYALTLQTYLSENRNAAAAASQLHIHKSTFFYRLNRMEDLFDITVNEDETLFAYEYSFRLIRYLGGEYK